jgi:hypothetical protein
MGLERRRDAELKGGEQSPSDREAKTIKPIDTKLCEQRNREQSLQ